MASSLLQLLPGSLSLQPASEGSQGRRTLSERLIWDPGQDRGAWGRGVGWPRLPRSTGCRRRGPGWGEAGPGAERLRRHGPEAITYVQGGTGRPERARPQVRGACPASGGHPAQDTADPTWSSACSQAARARVVLASEHTMLRSPSTSTRVSGWGTRTPPCVSNKGKDSSLRPDSRDLAVSSRPWEKPQSRTLTCPQVAPEGSWQVRRSGWAQAQQPPSG